MSYIEAVDKLLRQSRHITGPSEDETQTVLHILARSPVDTYAPFTRDEVRLIGRYRYSLDKQDRLWEILVKGSPETWLTAVHEAAELNAFCQRNANPFLFRTWDANLPEAHLQAVAVELQFLKAWANQLAMELSESAIEKTNPIRKQFAHQHQRVFAQLALRMNWNEPDEAEMRTAEQFWRRILSEERP